MDSLVTLLAYLVTILAADIFSYLSLPKSLIFTSQELARSDWLLDGRAISLNAIATPETEGVSIVHSKVVLTPTGGTGFMTDEGRLRILVVVHWLPLRNLAKGRNPRFQEASGLQPL